MALRHSGVCGVNEKPTAVWDKKEQTACGNWEVAMPELRVQFTLSLYDAFRNADPKGALLNRWIPNGAADAITLTRDVKR
jgi:hypothetical protein